MGKAGAGIIIAGVVIAGLSAGSARWLVVDQPQPADVIVVLAGETDRRPKRGLELLDQGYGHRLVLDVPEDAKLYQWTDVELAQKYVQSLPEAGAVTICPIQGLSTKAEAIEVGRYLTGPRGQKVLLVTSDFHTRRAISIFRREVPQYQYSVAAAYDPKEFGPQWWRHREWAKKTLDEWLKLAWWNLIDRWF